MTASWHILKQKEMQGGGFMFRNGKLKGICAIALGIGILLAQVLPIGVIVFLAALSLIVLGLTWLKCS